MLTVSIQLVPWTKRRKRRERWELRSLPVTQREQESQSTEGFWVPIESLFFLVQTTRVEEKRDKPTEACGSWAGGRHVHVSSVAEQNLFLLGQALKKDLDYATEESLQSS